MRRPLYQALNELIRPLLLTCCAVSMQSCGFLFSETSSPEALHLPLPRAGLFQPLSGSPEILKGQGQPESEAPIFMTGLKRCGIAEDASIGGLARHLFVGLTKINTRERVQREIGGASVVKSTVEAELDGAPLRIVALSSLHNNCVFDVVLWSARGERPQESWQAFEAAAEESFSLQLTGELDADIS